MRKSIFALLVLGISVGLHAGDKKDYHNMEPYKGSAPFDMMKSLAGEWTGTSKMGDEEHPAHVVYRLTANGSAVLETVFPNTPHEMVSVYHDDNGKNLTMTHYCGLGNQPKMSYQKGSSDTLQFVFAKGQNDLVQKPHMHNLTITMDGTEKMTQNWTLFEDGKEKLTTKIYLTRKLN